MKALLAVLYGAALLAAGIGVCLILVRWHRSSDDLTRLLAMMARGEPMAEAVRPGPDSVQEVCLYSFDELPSVYAAYLHANALGTGWPSRGEHLPEQHWRGRRRPVLPFTLDHLGCPGVLGLLEMVRFSGEFGDDGETRALYEWWQSLPTEKRDVYAGHVLGIVARPKTLASATVIWNLTTGRYRDLAWGLVATFPPGSVPFDPAKYLVSDDTRACYFAAKTLRAWGVERAATEALLRKALADPVFGKSAERALQELREAETSDCPE